MSIYSMEKIIIDYDDVRVCEKNVLLYLFNNYIDS